MARNRTNAQRVSRRTRRARRGAALVEAALVLPICLTFLLAIFEYGRFTMTMQVLNNAAREGVRYALTHTQSITIGGVTNGNSTSDVQTIVTRALGGVSLQGQSVQVYRSNSTGTNQGTWTTAQFGELICVRITGNYQATAPSMLFLSSSIPVQVQAIMRSEAN